MRRTGAGRERRGSHVLVARWLLLGAVVAGILGMHVLTGGDAMDHHAGVPTASVSPVATMDDAMSTGHGAPVGEVRSADPTAAYVEGGDAPGTPDRMAGCTLFLAAGAVLLLMLVGRGRPASDSGADLQVSALHVLWRRGPPRWPLTRLALGVSRI